MLILLLAVIICICYLIYCRLSKPKPTALFDATYEAISVAMVHAEYNKYNNKYNNPMVIMITDGGEEEGINVDPKKEQERNTPSNR